MLLLYSRIQLAVGAEPADRRELILLTACEHQSKKKPHHTSNKLVQQGYSFSSKIVRFTVYFTPPQQAKSESVSGLP